MYILCQATINFHFSNFTKLSIYIYFFAFFTNSLQNRASGNSIISVRRSWSRSYNQSMTAQNNSQQKTKEEMLSPIYLCWLRPSPIYLCWLRPSPIYLCWLRPSPIYLCWLRPSPIYLCWLRPSPIYLCWHSILIETESIILLIPKSIISQSGDYKGS